MTLQNKTSFAKNPQWVQVPPPASLLNLMRFQPRVLAVLLHLKSSGYCESSILPYGRRLRYLARHVCLDDPERVNSFISTRNWTSNYKGNVVLAYAHYVRFHGLVWKSPCYQRVDREFKIPSSEDVAAIISHAKLKGALFYSVVSDTGMRPIEASGLRVKDVDVESGEVRPTTAKGGSARKLRLKNSTVAMWKRYVETHKLKLDSLVFATPHYQEPYKIAKLLEDNWTRLRNSVAEKLQKPELRHIRLYDLRHAFGTRTYLRTKDLVFTKHVLGHRSVNSTLRYIHVLDVESQEWTCKTAKDTDEAKSLVEQNFEYVATSPDGLMLFRKPK